jgi:hypothetical protein
MDTVLAKLTISDFMEIGEWVPGITGDAEPEKFLLLLGLLLTDFPGEACKRIPLVALNKRLK